jgi:hypothetical protein
MAMPDLLMNEHTCVTDTTTYTILYVWFNDECGHIFYW